MLDKKLYTNGQAVYTLKNNILTYFFKTGIKRSEGKFIKEKMQGEWTFYRENGQLWGIGNFKDSVKHGKWIRYDKKGKLEYSEEFDNGKIIKKPKK